ncbi:MAG: YdcF family protein, partial [Chlorobia bacterium]|nr:YdcF family protein [Fimbriimonadaceae bacterium]
MTKRKKRILVWTSVLLGLPLIWCVGVAIAIVRAGAPNSGNRADIAIVLGAAVWDDKPSPVFAARIDHAVTLFKNGHVKGIIFTGGRAAGDRLSESRAAREYALAKGVPLRAIYCEEISTSTYGNLANAKGILQHLGMRKALIVSDPYHLLRAGMIAD